jgi:hypothetical protein
MTWREISAAVTLLLPVYRKIKNQRTCRKKIIPGDQRIARPAISCVPPGGGTEGKKNSSPPA